MRVLITGNYLIATVGHKNKAFTLLELLLVIGIIGLLSTIIIVVVRGARARAQDASIESHLAQVRTASQMHITEKGNYTGLFTDETEAKKVIDALGEITEVTTSPGSQEYCVQAEAKTSGHYCLDSTGRIGKGICASNICYFNEEEIVILDSEDHTEEDLIIEICRDYCMSSGYSEGLCRQASVRCTQNDETHEEQGDEFCSGTGGQNVCCCKG